MSEDSLMHYGTPRHSGRYPWGSGKDPYQSARTFRKNYEDLNQLTLKMFYHMNLFTYVKMTFINTD